MSGDSKPTRTSTRGKRDTTKPETTSNSSNNNKKETEAKKDAAKGKAATTVTDKKKATAAAAAAAAEAEKKKATTETTATTAATKATRSGETDKKKAVPATKAQTAAASKKTAVETDKDDVAEKTATTVVKEEMEEENERKEVKDTETTEKEAAESKQKEEDDETAKNESIAADALVDAAGILPEGMAASTPSKDVIRTVYWPAAGKRFDQITIEDDFEFDDATQTISTICDKTLRHFPNTHFMRRLAGHLRLGLGRNATKEAILEKICHIHYGSEFSRPIPEGESSGGKRRSSEAGLSGSTVLKKRPVVLSGKGKASGSIESNLKARATALTAWSSSLDTIATTIRQTEDRLQKMCQEVDVSFFAALMDHSKLPNDYLREKFEEYENVLALQKKMIAKINDLGGEMQGQGPPPVPGAGVNTKASTTMSSVEAKTIGVPAILKAAETTTDASNAEEMLNPTEV